MIKPVNGHLLIEPIKHESFMASQKEVFEEVGIVLDFDENINDVALTVGTKVVIENGMKVFFDSWLAAKFPKNETEYFWLVKWEDVRAVDNEEIPE